ncbi:HIT family protein [candidate division KSB1 bacterium]|nr:HIT family protein [candidate division KSB1 bacterium]NIR68365.1 HIT family protein [candidate division KSB1 bacterium]NIS22550.1 HIT family protein [candidate division KSB1 bacterium]NIT69386.1 HIT family protein [candidate division KSB1 bacterium]NIU23047.1 HIT family protein [candidate division KSB1 bacterium]
MKCAFCDIVAGDASSFIVFEDEVSLAFLDKRPLFPGHTLLVPKQHFGTFAELDDSLIEPLFRNARLLAQAIETAMKAEGTFVALNNKVSQSVPHLHIHVVPRRRKDGLRGFFWPRNPYKDDQHIREVQNKIKEVLNSLS